MEKVKDFLRSWWKNPDIQKQGLEGFAMSTVCLIRECQNRKEEEVICILSLILKLLDGITRGDDFLIA